MPNATNIAARKLVRQGIRGRKKGSKNAAPRVKRPLTNIQRLREHLLIELGLDKSDIAKAIGATRQNVSHCFADEYRSEIEGKIVAQMRSVYLMELSADREAMLRIDMLFGAFDIRLPNDPAGCPIMRETLGWSERSAPSA